MAEMILVRSLLPQRDDDGWPVALYEQDDAHPDGEAYVAGPDPVEVARTGLVNRRISEGALEIVERPRDAPAPPPTPSAEQRHPDAGAEEVIPGVTEAQQRTLVAAGYVTAEDIRQASDADLLKVDGVGPATVAALREATKE